MNKLDTSDKEHDIPKTVSYVLELNKIEMTNIVYQ